MVKGKIIIGLILLIYFFSFSYSYANCVPNEIIKSCYTFINKYHIGFKHECFNQYCNDRKLMDLLDKCFKLIPKFTDETDKYRMALGYSYASLCLPDTIRAKRGIEKALKFALTDIDRASVLVNLSIIHFLENKHKDSLNVLEQAEVLIKNSDSKEALGLLNSIRVNKCSIYKTINNYNAYNKMNCDFYLRD